MLLFSSSQKENAVSVLITLVKKLNVRVSSATINSCLHDHPDYPSLLALSDCLTEWKIRNKACQIDKNEYNYYWELKKIDQRIDKILQV